MIERDPDTRDPENGRRVGPSMNRTRVIVWMTLAVGVLLGWLMIAIFDGLPPWPVLLWFVLSHAFFCAVVMRVRPFRGPYVATLTEPRVRDWEPR
jgi:hypothetical protein